MKPESWFWQTKVMPFLKALPNTWFFKAQLVSTRGIPDVIMCIRGHFIALELKRRAGIKSGSWPLQKHNIHKIMRKGMGAAFAVDPETWPGVEKALSAFACNGENWYAIQTFATSHNQTYYDMSMGEEC